MDVVYQFIYQHTETVGHIYTTLITLYMIAAYEIKILINNDQTTNIVLKLQCFVAWSSLSKMLMLSSILISSTVGGLGY